MFESLQERLGSVFDGLTRKGVLKEADVDAALREVRVALLEADVALSVARDFIAEVRVEALGEDVLRSISPGQMVIKIVHDHLVSTLGSETTGLELNVAPPAVIMLVGLQGAGKTTAAAKIGARLTRRDKKKVLMASLDVQRPAAQEQLKVLGEQAEVATLPILKGQLPVDIAKRALQAAKLQSADVLILDTAGRLHVDEALMAELDIIARETTPAETILVADALTGQDAVNVAQKFSDRVNVTGVMLTRIDGDGRGGAALSMRKVTGVPIKLLGTGEGIEDLEDFHPDRIASRIMGMGDVVSLVEKAAETIDAEDAEKLAKKMRKGQFDLNDMASQLAQMRKMGGMSGIMNMLPGVKNAKAQLAAANMDDKAITHQEAMLSSMTKAERAKPKLLNSSRKRRIAAGSGTTVQEINRLLKQYKQAGSMMKKMSKMSKKDMARMGLGAAPPNLGAGNLGAGGGLPPGMRPLR